MPRQLFSKPKPKTMSPLTTATSIHTVQETSLVRSITRDDFYEFYNS